MAKRFRESGLFVLGKDGNLRPLNKRDDAEEDDEITPPAPYGYTQEGEQVDEEHRRYRVRRIPHNFYELLLEVGRLWGFPALICVACLAFGGYAMWKMVGWNRDDAKAFLSAVQANTETMKEMHTEQAKQTDILKDLDDKLDAEKPASHGSHP